MQYYIILHNYTTNVYTTMVINITHEELIALIM